MSNDEWYTPIWLLERVQGFYQGEFLDPASSPESEPYVGASKFYFKEQDGLLQPWSGRVWLNPPYSQPSVTQFTQKLLADYQAHNVSEALLLVNSCTETKWFQNVAKNCDRRLDILGRLHFWNPINKSNRPKHGQCLFYFGNNPTRFEETFGDLGIIYSMIEKRIEFLTEEEKEQRWQEGLKSTKEMFKVIEEWMGEDPAYDREVYPQLEENLKINKL